MDFYLSFNIKPQTTDNQNNLTLIYRDFHKLSCTKNLNLTFY